MESTLWQKIVHSFLTYWVTPLTTFLGLCVKLWYDGQRRKKEEEKKETISKDMNQEYEHKLRVAPILERIRYELDADRVLQCSFSNGDITFTGYHMKKMSITEEVHGEGLENIAPNFQMLPTKVFERNLDKLYHSENDYIISDETQYKDDLSILNLSYGLSTVLMIKLRDNGKWIGLLKITYSGPHELKDEDIIFAKTQASSI